MKCDRIVFSGHAVLRMFGRAIRRADVREAIERGEVVEDYPRDLPFPSWLMLSFVRGRPLHVVVAFDRETGTCHMVTAYVPDSELWNQDFRTRRSS